MTEELLRINDCGCCAATPCESCPCLWMEISGFEDEFFDVTDPMAICFGGCNCNIWNSLFRIQQAEDCESWQCLNCPENTCPNMTMPHWNALTSRWECFLANASCPCGGLSFYLAGTADQCPIGVWTLDNSNSCDTSNVTMETFLDPDDCACFECPEDVSSCPTSLSVTVHSSVPGADNGPVCNSYDFMGGPYTLNLAGLVWSGNGPGGCGGINILCEGTPPMWLLRLNDDGGVLRTYNLGYGACPATGTFVDLQDGSTSVTVA